MTENGAPQGNNVEPFSAPELLEELENWSEVLKSEPEVIHRLAGFADAADGEAEAAHDTHNTPPTLLHKSGREHTFPFPGRIYPTAFVTGMPIAV